MILNHKFTHSSISSLTHERLISQHDSGVTDILSLIANLWSNFGENAPSG